jgi:uncharacterized protein
VPQAVEVRQSAINQEGVFALARFGPGELILAIDDSYVVDEEHPAPEGEENHCDYLEAGKVVWMQMPERYINHSCDPNVYVKTIDGVRQVIALREIHPGQEITYDYCVNGYGDVVWQCNCQSARCRRDIHSDFFHLPIELQSEYLPFLDTWFVRERAGEVADLVARLGR